MLEGRQKSLSSRRNRRMRTRMYGGVGAGTDLLGQSPATRLCAGQARLFAGALRERTNFNSCVKRDIWGVVNQGVSPVPVEVTTKGR
jgi:hypothetical protein